MQFGLYAPMPGIVREVPRQVAGEDAWYRFAHDAVTAADEAGFGICLVAQRILGPDLEAWILSSALAAVTSRIHIMTAVHPIFWNPQLTAKMGASLDRLSGGRFDVNLVTGWYRDEQHKYGGLPIDDTRYERSEEFVQLIRRLWAEERVSHHSPHYQLEDVPLHMKPLGTPLFYTTTRSEPGLQMAARIADWWFVPCGNEFWTLADNLAGMKAAIADMNRRAGAVGRKVRYCVSAWLIHDEDEQRAFDRAQSIYDHGKTNPLAGEKQSVNKIHSNGLGIGLIGSRGRILDRIAELEEIGVEMCLLRIEPMVDVVHDVGEHFIPYVNRASSPEIAQSRGELLTSRD